MRRCCGTCDKLVFERNIVGVCFRDNGIPLACMSLFQSRRQGQICACYVPRSLEKLVAEKLSGVWRLKHNRNR
jgi:hypothetical protein